MSSDEEFRPSGSRRGGGKKRRAPVSSSEEDEASEDMSSSGQEDEEDRGRAGRGKGGQQGKGGGGGRGGGKGGPAAKRGRTQQQPESEDEDEPDEDGYGSDLYEDDADRERLEGMTELDREMILADRAEDRDKARQRKQLLKATREAAEKQAQVQAPRARDRQSSRQKQEEKSKGSALQAITAARKRREERESASGGGASDEEASDDLPGLRREDYNDEGYEPSKRERGRKKGKKLDDEEGGEEGGDEEEEGRSEGGEEEEEEDGHERAEEDDFKAIQLTRVQLEALHDKLCFEGDGLLGAVVRMAYGGMTRDAAGNAVPVMMVMKLLSIITNDKKAYPFGPRQAPCHKYLYLEDGLGNKREFPMTSVSNQQLKPEEVERYFRHTERANRKPMSRKEVAQAKGRITEALNYRWDSSKVKELLDKKRAAGALPVNVAAEKSRLRRMLEEASASNNAEEVASLEAQLRELEDRASLGRTGDTRTYGMSHINKRNQQANFDTAFKNVSNKPANAPTRKGGADPFSRRETRPNISWNTSGGRGPKEQEEAAARAKQAAAAKAAAAASLAAPVQLKGTLARMDPAQLIQHLDISIDVQPLQDFSIAPPMAKRLLGPRWDQSLRSRQLDLRGKKVTTLDDWRMRTALECEQAAV